MPQADPDLRGLAEAAYAALNGKVVPSASAIIDVNWQAARVRDGKVRWWATFRTEREALDAVGLTAE